MTKIQISVLRLVQAMTNAAPNASILDEFSTIVENSGGSTIPLAKLLAESPIYISEIYSDALSDAEFAAAFIENLVGDSASIKNKALAVSEIGKLIRDGMSRGEVMALVADELPKISEFNPDWGNAALQFRNKVEVASAYAIDEQGSAATLDILQAVTHGVTQDPKSISEAIARFTEDYQGVVVDGYVAGATVFVDIDGDGVRGPFEPATTTDAQGNFSFPGGQNTFGQLISTGGTDISTGQPFEGTLTASAGSTVVNPLTTLIDVISKTPGSTVDSAKVAVLTALGLDSSVDLQNFDPLANSTNPNATQEQKELALKIQSAAAQINTIAQHIAAVLEGTGTTSNGNVAAYQAVADALSAASSTAGQPIDLTSGTLISNIVDAAAIAAGATAEQQAAVNDLADDASRIIANLTSAIVTAVGDGTGDVTSTLNNIAKVQVVSGNTASTVKEQSASAVDIGSVVTATSGDNLTNSLNDAESELGDVDGDGVSNATDTDTSGGSGGGGGGGDGVSNATDGGSGGGNGVSNATDGGSGGGDGVSNATDTGGGSGPATTFTVTQSAGVVEFSGTATGNITVVWAGTVGASVATFTRSGIDASEEPDFDTGGAGTATKITLTAGQNFESDVTTLTAMAVTANKSIDGDGSIVLTDNPVDAAGLNTLDTAITATINASAATTVTGTGSDFDTIIGSAEITLSGSYAATVNGTPTLSELNTIDAHTSGMITATPGSNALATLNTLTGSGHAYTLIINDAGTVAASDLTTLDGKTTVAVDATSAGAVTGTGTELSAAFDSVGINLDANVASSVSGSITAAQQATLDGNTTGTITATVSNGDLATLTAIANANDNNALTITLTDTAANIVTLLTVQEKTSVSIDATSVTTLAGPGSNLDNAYNSGDVTFSGNEDVTITDTVSPALIEEISTFTGGDITATVTAGDAFSLFTNLGAASGALTLTVTGPADANDLNALDTASTVTIDASGITSLSGTTTNILMAIAGDITFAGNVPISSDNNPSIADANALDTATTGVVTATFAADTLASFNSLTGIGNAYTLIINDVGSVAAVDLTALDEKTTIAVDATSAAAVSGTGTEVAAALASSGLNLSLNATLILVGSITTAEQTTLDSSTTATITATISDSDMATLAGIADANGNNALTITVTDASVAAEALNTLDGRTSEIITASVVTTLTGSAAAIAAAISSAGVSLNIGVGATLDTGSVSASDLDIIETNTSADVNMTAVTNVTLAAGESFNFNGSTVTGASFNLDGAGDNGGESFIVDLGSSGEAVDLSNITVDGNDVTVTIIGGIGADTITATAANDTINAGAGTDSIIAGAGTDTIDLGNSDGVEDTVRQNAGDSTNIGAISDVSGGEGVFADIDTISTIGVDTISNFEEGIDKIAVIYTPSVGTQNVADSTGGIGASEFTVVRGNNAGGIFTVDISSGADLLLIYDTDGFANIETLVLIGAGGITFTAADFVNPFPTLTAAAAAVTALPDYHISDTVAAIVSEVGSTLNDATTITTTDTTTVAQALILEQATNSGPNYIASISDSATEVAGSSDAVLKQAIGAVTATGDATVSEAVTISGFATVVIYDVNDTAANVAAAGTALDGAANITITGTATIAQATTIENASNTGTNIYSVADAAASLDEASDSIIESTDIDVTVTNATDIATLNAIDSLWGAVTPSAVSDTSTNLDEATDSSHESTDIDVTVANTVGIDTLEAIDLLWGTVTPTGVFGLPSILDEASDSVFETTDADVTLGTEDVDFTSLSAIDALWGTITIGSSAVAEAATNLDEASDSDYESTDTSVVVTDVTDIATLNLIDSLWGTVFPSGVQDVAALLDEASDSNFEDSNTPVTVTDAATTSQLLNIDTFWGTVTVGGGVADSIDNLDEASDSQFESTDIDVTVTDQAFILFLDSVDALWGTVTPTSVIGFDTLLDEASDSNFESTDVDVQVTGGADIATWNSIDALWGNVATDFVRDAATNLDEASDSTHESTDTFVRVTDTTDIATLDLIDALWASVEPSSIADAAANLDEAGDSVHENLNVDVTVTDSAAIATLDSIDTLWRSVTHSGIADAAANLDEASDSSYENFTIDVTVTDTTDLATLDLIDTLWGTVTVTSISDSFSNLYETNDSDYVSTDIDVIVTDQADISSLELIDTLWGTVTPTSVYGFGMYLDEASDSNFESTDIDVQLTGGADIATLILIDALWGNVATDSVNDTAANLDEASDSAYTSTDTNVSVTDTTDIATLDLIDALWRNVFPSAVADAAGNLDEAGDSVHNNLNVDVTVTDSTAIATLDSIDALWRSVTHSGIADAAANLDDASDSSYENFTIDVTVTDTTDLATLDAIDVLWGIVSPGGISDTIANANGLNFTTTHYTGTSGLTLTGSAGDQTVTGSDDTDVITGGSGVDTIFGGDGADLFIIESSTDGGVGETYDGGSSTDTLRVTGTATLDFSDDTLTSLEILDLTTDSAAQILTLTASQLNAISAINADAADVLTIDELHSASVTATNGTDTFSFTTGDTGVSITGFSTSADVLYVSGLASLTTQGSADALVNASAGGSEYDVTAGNASSNTEGVIIIDDEAASDWNDIDTIIGSALTVDSAVANNGTYVIAVDNGAETRLYLYSDVTDGFSAGDDLTLIGAVTNLQVAGFDSADFF